MQKIHDLKIEKQYLDAIQTGKKTWEIRNTSDRDFSVGDQLFLREWDGKKYTGKSTLVEVTYIMSNGFGMPGNYCIMSIIPVMTKRRVEC